MGVGVSGPIGKDKLEAFCVSTTFRLPNEPRKNGTLITCKICGAKVIKGCAHEVLIAGKMARSFDLSTYFLCDECYIYVTDMIEKDKRFSKLLTEEI